MKITDKTRKRKIEPGYSYLVAYGSSEAISPATYIIEKFTKMHGKKSDLEFYVKRRKQPKEKK